MRKAFITWALCALFLIPTTAQGAELCIGFTAPTDNTNGTAIVGDLQIAAYYRPDGSDVFSKYTFPGTFTPGQVVPLDSNCFSAPDIFENVKYQMACTAIDIEGDESAFSNFVEKHTYTAAPGPINPGTSQITWSERPPYLYYMAPQIFDGQTTVFAGTWSVPGQDLRIRATITRQAGMVSDARIISKSTGTAEQDHDFMLSQFGTGVMRFRLKTNGVTSTLVGTTVVPLDTPTVVDAVYDGAQMQIFINGVLDAATGKTGNMDQSAKQVHIGRSPDGYGAWRGSIEIQVN